MADKGNWIFVKLYNYTSRNPVYIVLSGFIKKVNPVKGFLYNHAAINTSLDDNYMALAVPKLKIEPSRSLGYAKRGSTQVDIYGINCTKDEYSKITTMLKRAMDNKSKIYYDLMSIVSSFLKTQLDRKKSNKYKDDNESYQNITDSSKIVNSSKNFAKRDRENPSEKVEENKYVCSSFVAYVLSSCIPEIKNYLKKQNMGSLSISPSEIAKFPRLQLLYRSDIGDLDKATKAFVEKNPSFDRYYHEDEEKPQMIAASETSQKPLKIVTFSTLCDRLDEIRKRIVNI